MLGFNECVHPCSRMCLAVKVQELLYWWFSCVCVGAAMTLYRHGSLSLWPWTNPVTHSCWPSTPVWWECLSHAANCTPDAWSKNTHTHSICTLIKHTHIHTHAVVFHLKVNCATQMHSASSAALKLLWPSFYNFLQTTHTVLLARLPYGTFGTVSSCVAVKLWCNSAVINGRGFDWVCWCSLILRDVVQWAHSYHLHQLKSFQSTLYVWSTMCSFKWLLHQHIILPWVAQTSFPSMHRLAEINALR